MEGGGADCGPGGEKGKVLMGKKDGRRDIRVSGV